MKPASQTKPRARQDSLVVQDLPDETLVYDLERDVAHCLNQTAAFVWRRCDGRTTPTQIARALGREVNSPVDENVVWLALDQLARTQLLTTVPVPPHPNAKVSRRELVRALGLSAAFALPMVASIVAPTPAQAASCLVDGQSCTASAQCCSNLCNSGCCTSCP